MADLRREAKSAARTFPPSLSRAVTDAFGGDETLFNTSWEGFTPSQPIQGVRLTLSRLRWMARLAVVADQGHEFRRTLESSNLAAFFDEVVLSEEVGLTKPDPGIFQEALDRLGLAPGVACMVGDRLDADVRPARSLGMLTIRVRRGAYYWQLPIDARSTPHATVRSVHALPHLLASWDATTSRCGPSYG